MDTKISHDNLRHVYMQDKDNLLVKIQEMRQDEGESVSKWIARVHEAALELRAVDPDFRESNERDILLEWYGDVDEGETFG